MTDCRLREGSERFPGPPRTILKLIWWVLINIMGWRKVHQLREHQISMQGPNTDLLIIFFIKEIKLNYIERNYAAAQAVRVELVLQTVHHELGWYFDRYWSLDVSIEPSYASIPWFWSSHHMSSVQKGNAYCLRLGFRRSMLPLPSKTILQI